MEWWSNGVLHLNPILQYSRTPILHLLPRQPTARSVSFQLANFRSSACVA